MSFNVLAQEGAEIIWRAKLQINVEQIALNVWEICYHCE